MSQAAPPHTTAQGECVPVDLSITPRTPTGRAKNDEDEWIALASYEQIYSAPSCQRHDVGRAHRRGYAATRAAPWHTSGARSCTLRELLTHTSSTAYPFGSVVGCSARPNTRHCRAVLVSPAHVESLASSLSQSQALFRLVNPFVVSKSVAGPAVHGSSQDSTPRACQNDAHLRVPGWPGPGVGRPGPTPRRARACAPRHLECRA